MPTTLKSEKDWLLEMLNDSTSGFADFCDELKQLEMEAERVTRVSEWRRAEKRLRRAGYHQQDLPTVKGRRVQKAYRVFQNHEDAINAKLESYASAPRLFFDIAKRRWGRTESWQEENPASYLAVRYFLLLVAGGRLNRVRQCSNCRSWFLARREDQMCCSTKCRKKQCSTDPSFKAERRDYMTKYRENEKGRKEKGISTR